MLVRPKVMVAASLLALMPEGLVAQIAMERSVSTRQDDLVRLDMGRGANSRTTSAGWARMLTYGAPTPGAGGAISPNYLEVIDTTRTRGYLFSAQQLNAVVGSNASGNKQAFEANMGVNGTGLQGGDFAAIASSAYAVVNVGGAGGPVNGDPDAHYRGGLFGGNDHPRLAQGATHWRFLAGREINVEIERGASAYVRYGLIIATGENGASRAVADDAAINIANKVDVGNSWKTGIQFGSTVATWPFDTSSTIIGGVKRLYPADGRETVVRAGYGIDLRMVSFSRAAFASPGFSVDGQGNEQVETLNLREISAGDVATPSAGRQTLFIDRADHKLKRKDSSGAITIIG